MTYRDLDQCVCGTCFCRVFEDTVNVPEGRLEIPQEVPLQNLLFL